MTYGIRRRLWRLGLPVGLAVLAGMAIGHGLWMIWVWPDSLSGGVASPVRALLWLALVGQGLWLIVGAALGCRGSRAWIAQSVAAWLALALAALQVLTLPLAWSGAGLGAACAGCLVAGLWRGLLDLAVVRAFYHLPSAAEPGWSDRLLENLRTGGHEPNSRRGVYMSVIVHILVLVVLPAAFSLSGCAPEIEQAVDGNPCGGVVFHMKPVKKPKKKQFAFNPNSAIHFPKSTEIEDLSDAINDLDEATDRDNPHTAAGHIGDGPGDGTGQDGGPGIFGDPDGGRVGFYRLSYNGGDWDQDLAAGADRNMLMEIGSRHRRPVMPQPQVITPLQLGRYRDGKGPAFVYVTGSGAMRLSDAECQALRHYLVEEGGMLFGDHGGGRFHMAFSDLLGRVIPEARMVTVSRDDPLWSMPHALPGGPPAGWAHSGQGPVWGVKVDGRWLALFHTGDLGDSWKDGHNGGSDLMTRQAYDVGIDIIAHAYRQHSQHHRD